MTLQQLRCIVEVSRQRLNITAAARTLHMTQPGVSRHVRMFEDEIGVRVFIRSALRAPVSVVPPFSGDSLIP